MSDTSANTAYKNTELHVLLTELQTIDQTLLDSALAEAEKNNLCLEEIITKQNLMDEVTLGQLIADLIGTKHINLSTVTIPLEILTLIPENVAKAQNTVAYKKDATTLYVCSPTPKNPLFYEMLKKKSGLDIVIHYTTTNSLKQAFLLYSKNIGESFKEIIDQSVEESKRNPKAQPPIITLVDTIIIYAHRSNVSDVHIEPLEKQILVRFRIDGFLHDIVTLPSELMPLIVTRIKVLAKLRTDEHQNSQDGKIHFTNLENQEKLDIRVSIAPTTSGEKVVMRILAENAGLFSLEDLGLSPRDFSLLKKAASMPNGMILCTGPTGSGKTTSLYAVLRLINKRDINIMTIEDPVEYQIDTINQMQVNVKAGLTFANGLRSIVRQDPDVILVGEIRDTETADIAVNSAMTGHLVLSSLHTNDAATTFPRLIDMEVEPYLLASTINIVIAQRLVRKICSACKISQDIKIDSLDTHLAEQVHKHQSAAVSKMTTADKKVDTTTFRGYIGKGCPVCHDTGYKGRVGVFELLEVTDEIKSAVIAKKSANEINALAIEQGMKTMLDDGIDKVKQGLTTFEELLRVTKQSD